MNIQYSLFRQLPALQLVRDAEGGICYHAACIAADECARWFEQLLSAVAWRHLQRSMYDRVVDVPRLVANHDLQDAALAGSLRAALAAVVAVAPAPYTRVGLNLYRDGADSVAPHGDRDDDLVPGQPIAIVSLGAPRTMLIRPLGGGDTQQLVLEPGSILVMSHASQRTHTHAIPKTAQACSPRISLAFRVRRFRQGRRRQSGFVSRPARYRAPAATGP